LRHDNGWTVKNDKVSRLEEIDLKRLRFFRVKGMEMGIGIIIWDG
jgi:hypothetical protein